MIEEVTLLCSLIFTLSQPNPTHHQAIDTIAPNPTSVRRPARAYSTSVLSFDESANQVLDARPVVVRRRNPQTGKRTVKEVLDLSEVISRSAELENIDPKLVEIVIKHESAFQPSAQSGVGACGLMQLMPETAKELGVTDITDPEQNIAAGTRYLAQQVRHYQDLKLALAAYNAGPGNVDHYGTVPPFEETQNYSRSITHEYVTCRVAR